MSLLARLRAVRAGEAPIEVVDASERPADLEAAYELARQLVGDARIAGYKIGATSPGGRAFLGLDAPFFGRIVEGSLHRSPATLRVGSGLLTIEAEIGIEIGVDLPPRSRPYTRSEVAAAVRRVVPLVELNRPSYRDPMSVGGLALVADNGVNAGAVIGSSGIIGLHAIRDARVTLSFEGLGPLEGKPMSAAPDDPLSCLEWLANALPEHSGGLVTGQVVATGAMTTALPVPHDGTAVADFRALGSVQIQFVR